MENIFRYIFLPIVISILLCLPGVLFDIWLRKIGVSRESNMLSIIIITLFFSFLKQPVYANIPWWIYGIFAVFATTLVIHRSNLGETMKHGNWWWLPKKKKKKNSNSI